MKHQRVIDDPLKPYPTCRKANGHGRITHEWVVGDNPTADECKLINAGRACMNPIKLYPYTPQWSSLWKDADLIYQNSASVEIAQYSDFMSFSDIVPDLAVVDILKQEE